MQTEVTLPKWLDDYIFDELGAKYCRSSCDMTVIDWDKSDVLNYLGTYFPRSYAEAYCIFSDFFEKNLDEWKDRTELSVFDFGCGTGGEIIGLLEAARTHLPNIRTFRVKGLDGNHHALRLLEGILDQYKVKFLLDILFKSSAIKIDDDGDLTMLDGIIDDRYDIVMTFKALNEFITQRRLANDVYKSFVDVFAPKVSACGILTMVDITSKNKSSEEWIPVMMDKGIGETRFVVVSRNDGFNKSFTTSHSRNSSDLSKVAWRIVKI